MGKRTIAAVAAAAALTGCAVMKIDVDVYKGPLANHEKVQVQQMAAMATGAKALLVDLRDRIEWEDEEARYRIRIEPEWSGYRDGYMDQHRAQNEGRPWFRKDGRKWFEKEQAARVNDILGLYEDQVAPELGEYLEKAGREIARYGAAMAVLQPDAARDDEAWKGMKGGFVPDAELPAHFAIPVGKDKRTPLEIVEKMEELGETLRWLVRPGSSGKRRVSKRLVLNTPRNRGILLAYRALRASVSKSKGSTLPEVAGLGANERGTLAHLKALSDRSNADALAAALFSRPNSAEAERFKLRIMEIARAHLDAQDALAEIWKATASAIAGLGDTKGRVEPQVVQKMVQFLGVLTQPRNLAIAIGSGLAPAELERLIADQGNPAFWRLQTGDFTPDKHGQFYSAADGLLATGLARAPAHAAYMLLQADQLFKTASTVRLPNEIGNELSSVQARSAGLVRGPTEKVDFNATMREFEAVSESINQTALARGRLPWGIESLNEKFLTRSSVPEPTDPVQKKQYRAEVLHAQNQLTDALVRFSAKLLTLANNKSLLEPTRFDPVGLSPEVDKFVVMLQAVGNSILIQADELRHKETHAAKLTDGTGRALRALEEALGRTNERIFDDMALVLDGMRKKRGEEVEAAKAKKALAEKLKGIVTSAKLQTEADYATANTPAIADEATLRNEIGGWVRIGDAMRVLKGTLPISAADKSSLEDFLARSFPDVSPHGGGAAVSQQITGPDLRDKIVVWIQQALSEYPETLKTVSRRLVLANARAYFDGEGRSTFDSLRKGKHSEVLDAARKSVDKRWSDAKAKLTAKEKELQGSLEKADATLSKAEKAAAEVVNAITAVNSRRKGVLAAAETNNLRDDPKELHSLLVNAIRKDMKKPHGDAGTQCGDAAASNEWKQWCQLRDAAKIVNTVTPSDPIGNVTRVALGAGPGATGEVRNSREVLDSMIDLLRYQHLLAVERYGAEHGRAKNLEQALAFAMEHRAGFAYLRPSMAYLRSSFAASALQDNDGGWRNMLARHGVRNLPLLAGELIVNSARPLATIQDIDKQFWQNINSVRVAGAGDTNYAIAKDDVGNWYVKSYSADPEKIINSARNLALFNLGPQAGANLLGNVSDAGTKTAGTDAEPVQPKSGLAKVFDRYHGAYQGKTTADVETVKEHLGGNGIAVKLVDTLNGIPTTAGKATDLARVVNNAAKGFEAPLAALEADEVGGKPVTAFQRGGQIVEGLWAMRRFRGAVIAGIDGLALTANPEKTLAEKRKAVADLESEIAMAEAEENRAKADHDKTLDDAQKVANVKDVENKDLKEYLNNRVTEQGERWDNAIKARKELEAKRPDARKQVDDAYAALLAARNTETAAKNTVATLIDPILAPLVKSRQSTVGAFETAVMFVGDATRPDEPAEKEAAK